MQKTEIEKIVDKAFDSALKEIRDPVNKELYPGAFADEYSWLRVKTVLDLHNSAMRKAVKSALNEILGEWPVNSRRFF